MHLVRLIYASRVNIRDKAEDISDIYTQSLKNNTLKNITGFLCYDEHYFLQLLEGPRTDLNKLYIKILKDTRHEHVEVLDYRDIKKHQFGGWSMDVVNAREIEHGLLRKYCPHGEFDPYVLSAEQAHDLLVELARDRQSYLEAEIHPSHY